MRLHLLSVLLSVSVLFTSSCAGKRMPAIKETTSPDLARLDLVVDEGLQAKVFPGAVLIVGQPGKVLWAKAYGHTTYDEAAPSMTLDSIFDLASVSKVIGTTSAALKLMDEGKLSPDDAVSRYIPGFDSNGKEGDTVRDLMTHVSGLKAYESKDVVEKERTEGELTSDALITHYAALKASYPPRSKVVYSCLNFQTTARVTENITGERMEAFLKREVYGPLGMKDTVYTLSPDQLRRAVPTLKKDDGSVLLGKVHDPLASYHGFEEHCPGNAGLFASPRNVARYMEMIANGGELAGVRIYSKDILDKAMAIQTPPAVDEQRGLGWDIYENPPWLTGLNKTPDSYVVGHTGYTGTLIWLDKKTKTYVVFFTNRVYPDDRTAPEGKPSITTVRKNVCDAVLRSQPVYAAWFAEQDAKKESGE